MRLGIFLTFFAVYLATTSREKPWGDANPVYEVAESMVRAGTFAQTHRWPPDAPPGRDGKFYAFNPLLTSLQHLPGVLLREALIARYPAEPRTAKVAQSKARAEALSLPWSSHLAPAALSALTCVLFFGLCLRVGASKQAATLATVVLGLGTGVWVYAHYTYTEALQTACFTGFLLALVRMLQERDLRSAGWLGATAALVLDSKIVYAAALPGAAALALWTLRRERQQLLRVVGVALAVFLPLCALIPFYNWARFGSPLDSGYNAYAGTHFSRGSLWTGLWGFFLSPGKSVFLYSPPLLIALWGYRTFAKRTPLVAVAVAVTVVPVILLNASSAFWHGDWAWGPRYLAFALPAALLPLAFVIDRLREARRRIALGAVMAGALAVGGFVQVLGLAFYWDHWVRIAAWDVKPQWLGQPNRGGATLIVRGAAHGPHCDACFEDMFAHQWLPPLSPLAGHFWMLKHVPFGHEWSRAQEDAPWRRTTTLKMTSLYYDQAKDKRLDWWILEWGEVRVYAALLMGALAMMLAGGVRLWRRGLGPPRAPPLAPAVPAAPPAAPEPGPEVGVGPLGLHEAHDGVAGGGGSGRCGAPAGVERST